MSFFQDLFGTGGDASKAAAAKSAGLTAAQAYAEPKYAQAAGDITTGYGAAQDILSPINNIAQGGAGAYADITGAAGTAGQDRARALYMTDPGYEANKAEQLKATQRVTGTGGYQESGNVLTALQDRASAIAGKQYGDYVSRLAPFLGYSLGTGTALAGANIGEGTALAKNTTDLANLGYGTQAGIGSATAGGILGDAQQRSQGINNILKIGGMAVGALTGAPAAGSLGSTLLGYLNPSGGGNQVSNSDPYGLSNYNYSYGLS